MDDLHETSTLFSTVAIEENEFAKLTIPLGVYERDAKFFSDGWQLDNFIAA